MGLTIDERVAREQAFHEQRFDGFDRRESQKKYYWAIWDGAEKYMQTVTEFSKNANVLEYGCGDADNWRQVGPYAKAMVGIDISNAAVTRLRNECLLSNVTFEVMDAHKLDFDDGSFDVVFGSGIIHHLDTERSAKEIARVLRPGGRAIFWEPLGLNPLINAYRKATPNARTVDEHPLMPKDYEILQREIGEGQLQFFGLCTILSVPITESRFRTITFNSLRKFDRLVGKLPGIRYLSWYCLSTLTKK
jgi:SAM-dependent methyltransferase